MRKLAAAGVLALGPATLGLVTLPGVATAGPAWQVTVQTSAPALHLGDTVVFKGVVRPGGAAAGKRVLLQEKYAPNRPWKTKDTDKVSADGHYRVSDKPEHATVRSYRVMMPSTGGHAQGISKQVEIKVYKWSRLTTMFKAVNNEYFTVDKTVKMNGNAYRNSLGSSYPYRTTHVEYNLDHQCVGLRATYGISDDSESGAQARVTVLSDGVTVFGKGFSLGQTKHKTIALDSPLKLRLQSQSLVQGVNGLGAIGSPDVLCTKHF